MFVTNQHFQNDNDDDIDSGEGIYYHDIYQVLLK